MTKQKRFEMMVNALSTDLYRYAYWLCKQPTLAEDLVQETFLRAWKAFDSLKDEKAAKAWLITILRREHARIYERITPKFEDIHDMDIALPESHGPEKQTDQQVVRQAILKLSKTYQEPLLLQLIGGFSGNEIADILDLKRETVMTRLFRARHQLQKMLSPSTQLYGDSKNG